MHDKFIWLKRMGQSIRAGVYRFPATIACALAIMCISLVLLHQENTLTQTVRQWLERSGFTLGLAIPLSVALQLFLERKRDRPVWMIAALWTALAALLCLYILFLLPSPLFLDENVFYRYIGIFVASVTLVVAIPALPAQKGDERFALKLLWRFVVTGAFTGILIGGVSLVLLMLDKLLGVDIGDKAYLDNIIVCLSVFAPSFFLAGVPGSPQEASREPFQPLMRILLGYIIFPLLAVYTAIIYSYFVRILILWSWPSNMLVNMVLWYTAIGVLALYFMRTQSEANRWFRLFDRWYPRFTVLPIVLMFVGLFIRIANYGFTEPRYAVLMLGIWVSCMTALAILSKPERRLNVIAPTLLALLALVTVLGPVNAFVISRSNQNARLEAYLARNNMLSADGFLQPGVNVPQEDQREIYAVLDYFSARHSPSDVRALNTLPENGDYAAILGFERPTAAAMPEQSPYYSIYLDMGAVSVLDVGGYDYFFTNFYGKAGAASNAEAGSVSVSLLDNTLTVSKEGQELYSKNLTEYMAQLDASYYAGKTYTQSALTFMDETETIRVKLIFQDIYVNHEDPRNPSYSLGSLLALVDIK